MADHGTITRYTWNRCRCDECREAARNAKKAYYSQPGVLERTRAINRERMREFRRVHAEELREKDRERYHRGNRYHGHAISAEDVRILWIEQGRVCRGCGLRTKRPEDLDIDHDHSCCPGAKSSCGRCIRGLLCRSCNKRDVLA